jgi:hypothetical protein
LGIKKDFDPLRFERIERIVPVIISNKISLKKYKIVGDVEDDLWKVLLSLSIDGLLEIECNIFGDNLEVSNEDPLRDFAY